MHKIFYFLIGLTVSIASFYFVTTEAQAGVVAVYPSLPDLPLSSTYTLTVDSQNVPVSTFLGQSFAWFSFSGTINVKVTANSTVSSHQLSPKSYNIPTAVNGREISFTLNQPRKLVLRKVNGMSEDLHIFADAPETNVPTLGSPGVFNAAMSSIQSAIDSASSYPGGGVAFVPAGSHSGSVNLKSNANLYLAPGAVVRASIRVNETTNAKITGRGVICCGQMLTHNNTNFHIHDVVIVNAPTTAFRLGYEVNSGVHNIKVLTGRSFDGIDTDGVFNFVVEDSFIWSGDDNLAIGSGTDHSDFRRPVNSDGYIIRNNVFRQTGSGKHVAIVPHLPWQAIRNILVENNVGIIGKQALGIWPSNGPVEISGVTIRNNRFEEINIAFMSIQSLDFSSWGGCGNGMISRASGSAKNILFDNNVIDNTPPSGSNIFGRSSIQNIDNVIINNLYINGTKATSLSSGNIGAGSFATNIRVTTDSSPLPIMPARPKLAINPTAADYLIDEACGGSGTIKLPAMPDPIYTVNPVFTGGSYPTPTPTPPPTGSLQGDLNKDGIVNSLDWSLMNSKWFTSDSTTDLNSDGIVNSLDFSIMNGNWLKTV